MNETNNLKSEAMANFEIIKKAYEIDFSKIEEGYLASDSWVYAETRNKAKSKLLKEVEYEGWKLKWEDEEITYLTIPIKRAKNMDLVKFEDGEIERYKIPELIHERERIEKLNEILNNKDIEWCYIVKGGSYYRPNSCGYTGMQHRAGIYKKEDAASSAKSCSELWIRPINIIEHNKMLNAEINELKQSLIPIAQ